MSPITQKKKCPVCGYVTKDNRLMNCPNCGTELILDVVLPNLNVQDSFFDTQINELKEEQLGLSASNKKIDQQAWQIMDQEGGITQYPLFVKKEVNLYPTIQIPRISFNFFRQYRVVSIVLISILSLLQSGSFLFLISSLHALLYQINSTKVVSVVPLLITGLVFYFIVSYLQLKFILFLKQKNFPERKLEQNFSFVSFALINAIQLFFSIMVLGVVFIIIRNSEVNIERSIGSQLILGLGLLILAPFLLVFRIAKMLSLMRKTGLFQNIYDSFQFSKFSLRRGYGILFLSILLPTFIVTLAIESVTRCLSFLFSISDHTGTTLNVVISIFLLLSISVLFTISNSEDLDILSIYESFLFSFSVPPIITWINKEAKMESLKEEKPEFEDLFNLDNVDALTEVRYCPVCSTKLPEDVDYCVNCGHPLRE